MSFLRCAASSLATRISLPSRPSANDSVNAEAIDHAVELFDHRLAHVGAAEPPGRDIRHFQRGAEHGRRQRRQERQHGARLDQAGAERIDDDDLAVAHGLQEAGDAEARRGVELQRIGEVGIDPAQDHLGAAQPRHGADEDAVVAHDEVLAVDQEQAEIARQIGVLEIGLVHRSRRQQAGARIVLAIERHQFGLESLEERRDALDAGGAIDVGNGARQRQAVLDGVAGARRRLRAIVEHPPAAVGAAADVDGIKTQMRAAGRRNADQRPQKFRIAADQRRRQAPLAGQRRRPVGIHQHGFEQLGALDQAFLQLRPLAGLDDERHMAERPRPLDARRILVDAIEHAGIAQVSIGGGEAAIDLLAAEASEHRQQRLPVRAHPAVAVHHLVENAGQPPIAGNELLQRGLLLIGCGVELR